MRLTVLTLLVTSLAACPRGDDTPSPTEGTYYGSCESRPPAGDPCVDYYCDSDSDCSDPATNGQETCESGGMTGEPGTWSTTPCPTEGLFGTCSVPTTGDGHLDNHYYTSSDNVGPSVCDLAGGTWRPG